VQVIVCPDEARVGQVAAAVVAKVAKAVGPSVVLGVATGSSPLSLYEALAGRVRAGLDLSGAQAFALDEYVGLPETHPESYHAVINRTVTVPLGIDPARVHVPDGTVDNLATAGERYEAAIKAAGGVDIQILGIGANGHIGFNEPTGSLMSRTHMVVLTERTRADNARFFASLDEVPRAAMTQGMATILDARATVLVAMGEGKAQAIADTVEGPVTAMVPASVLQWHPDATIVVDEAAASRLKLVDYYKQTYAGLPDWAKLDV